MTRPTADGVHARRTASPRLLFAMVSLGVFAASLDLFVVNVAMPDLVREFAQRDLGALSWVLNGYAIVYAALLVPAGRTADLLGRRRSFVVGMLLFTAASAACALAPSVGLLVLARLVQAAGAAMLTPASLGLVLPAFAPAARGGVIAAWSAVGAVGAATGPVLGGALTEVSWRLIFAVNLPLGLAAAVFAARRVPETRPEGGGRLPDLLGSLLVMVGVAGVVLAIVQGRPWGWTSGGVVASAVVGVLALASAVVRSTRHPEPALDVALLRVPSLAVAVAAATVFFTGFAAMLIAGVLFLTGVWGHSVLRAGAEMSVGPALAVVGAVAASRLGPRYGAGRVGAAGAVVVAVGLSTYPLLVTATPAYTRTFLPGQVLTGLGVGLALPAFTSLAVAAAPPARFATAIGLSTAFRQVGSALGVAVFVAVLGTPGPGQAVAAFGTAWHVMAVCVLAAAVLLATARRTAPATAPATAPVTAPATVSEPAGEADPVRVVADPAT
ncbi:MFS transporter [Lapillicoccus jejuensis]|uniref:EmrB/QacA subfamily drug resistance transporter n=1 Tax=Lapillicoccus jejuensis TaxID=402171 RepID=A0A542E036_9MICO|nr:MFS transporter [Lapillicoccus jejuensis]TQJ08721.1 EmrB/QacA subfamily drug resistance transporter [Lapillicoccus jejuensis]